MNHCALQSEVPLSVFICKSTLSMQCLQQVTMAEIKKDVKNMGSDLKNKAENAGDRAENTMRTGANMAKNETEEAASEL